MQLHLLPTQVKLLLDDIEVPKRLLYHLTIVHYVTKKAVTQLLSAYPKIQLDREALYFGAATHDIGKVMVSEELYHKGNKHEAVGQSLLLSHGFSEEYARFAHTHGRKDYNNLPLEDLLVILADKIWKGKRIHLLEEQAINLISQQVQKDYWEVFLTLDEIITPITLKADDYLRWQNQDA